MILPALVDPVIQFFRLIIDNSTVCLISEQVHKFNLLAERRAHAPLVARASVTHVFRVVVTENHLNRTATSGCVARLVVLLIYC
jgi:hypothetical protein